MNPKRSPRSSKGKQKKTIAMKKIIFLLLLLIGPLFCWASEDKEPETDDVLQAEKYQEYSEAFKRMDSSRLPEVIKEIEKRRGKTEEAKALFARGEEHSLTAVLGVVMPFLMIIAVVGFSLYFRYKRKKDLYALMAKFLESGKEVPIELLKEPKEVYSDLKKGLIGVALGIAGVIGGFMLNMKMVWIGLVPLLVGFAFILSHFLLNKKNEGSGN